MACREYYCNLLRMYHYIFKYSRKYIHNFLSIFPAYKRRFKHRFLPNTSAFDNVNTLKFMALVHKVHSAKLMAALSCSRPSAPT